jgi:hypothetical protein
VVKSTSSITTPQKKRKRYSSEEFASLITHEAGRFSVVS